MNRKMGKAFRGMSQKKQEWTEDMKWGWVSLQLEIQIKISVRYHLDLDDETSEEDNTKGTEDDVEKREQ